MLLLYTPILSYYVMQHADGFHDVPRSGDGQDIQHSHLAPGTWPRHGTVAAAAARPRLRPRRRADQLQPVQLAGLYTPPSPVEITHFYRQNAKFLHGGAQTSRGPGGPHPERQRICLKAVQVATKRRLMFFDIVGGGN